MTCYRNSTHVRNVLCSTLSFVIHWRSTYHGKNVTRSFVKQIPCQQCHVKEKYTKQGKESEWHTWWRIKRKRRSYMLKSYWVTLLLRGKSQGISVPVSCFKWSFIILSSQDDKIFQSTPIYNYRHITPLSCRLESKKLILQVVSAIRRQWISQFGTHVFLEWDMVYIKWECKGLE